jgi:hypothetical protein
MEDALTFFAGELDNIWDIDNILSNLTIIDSGQMAIYNSTYFKFTILFSASRYAPIDDANKVKYVTHVYTHFPYVFQSITEYLRRTRYTPIQPQPVDKVFVNVFFTGKLLFTVTLHRRYSDSTTLDQRVVPFANADLLMVAYDKIIQQLRSVESAVFTRSNKRGAYNDSRVYKFTSNAVDDSIGFELYFTDVVDEQIIHERVIYLFRESLLQLVDDLQTHSMRQIRTKYATPFPGDYALSRVAAQLIYNDPEHIRCTIIMEDTSNHSFEFNHILISSRTDIPVPVASTMRRSMVTHDPFQVGYDGFPQLLISPYKTDPMHAAAATYNNTFRQGPLVRIQNTNQVQEQILVSTVQSEDARLHGGAGKTRYIYKNRNINININKNKNKNKNTKNNRNRNRNRNRKTRNRR